MTSTAEPQNSTAVPQLNPLRTSFRPTIKDDDVPPTPPPAYFAGPNPHRFIRTGSWGAQEALSPTSQALQEQYVKQFTDVVTKWVGFGVWFWTYGIPVIKWSLFFFIKGLGGRGLGGSRELFLLACWFLIWVAPTLYFGIIGLDVSNSPNDEDPRYSLIFWITWGTLLGIKWGSMWWVAGLTSWWLWGGLTTLWMLTFGI